MVSRHAFYLAACFLEEGVRNVRHLILRLGWLRGLMYRRLSFRRPRRSYSMSSGLRLSRTGSLAHSRPISSSRSTKRALLRFFLIRSSRSTTARSTASAIVSPASLASSLTWRWVSSFLMFKLIRYFPLRVEGIPYTRANEVGRGSVETAPESVMAEAFARCKSRSNKSRFARGA